MNTILALLATVSAASCNNPPPAPAADAPKYQLYTIHSGSQYQYSQVHLDSHAQFSLDGTGPLTLQLGPMGFAQVEGWHLLLQDGVPTMDEDNWDYHQWTLDGPDLAVDGSSSFYVCPQRNNAIVWGGSGVPDNCGDGTSVQLYANQIN